MKGSPLLRINELVVEYATRRGTLRAVNGVSIDVGFGEAVGLVGESGCGKSTVGQAILQLIQPPGRIVGGEVVFEGADLRGFGPEALRRLRGDRIAMIFQDPTATLNPVLKVGSQVAELFHWHRPAFKAADINRRVVNLLRRVGISEPERRRNNYPYELSGGMRQRIVIACALALDPALIVADEPTTALDVTVQAQILKLMNALRAENAMSLLLISHDLAVIGQVCDRVVVMYAGSVMESGPVASVLGSPKHPYTRGLLDSRPRFDDRTRPLRPIAGGVPDLANPPLGCPFSPRCPLATHECRTVAPALRQSGRHAVACYKAT